MSFTVEEKIDILERFVGGRCLSDKTMLLFSDKFETIKETMYRGMQFPKHLIKEGYVMEEWNGSSHWSLDFDIARNIFSNDKFNISEDYCEEIANELGMSYEDVESDIFVPMVLKLDGVSSGIRIYKMMEGLNLVDRFKKEKEIATIGIDTVMKSIELKSDNTGDYYLVTVEEITR